MGTCGDLGLHCSIQCIICNSDTRVIRTTPDLNANTVRRSRQCTAERSHRFTSVEGVWREPDGRTVRKRDGSSEPFSVEKLRQSLVRAAPVKEHEIPPRDIDAFIERVVRALPTGDPVSSTKLGELVLLALVSPNSDVECARARFALVQRRRIAPDDGVTTQIGAFSDWLQANYPEACVRGAEVAPQRVIKQRSRQPAHFNSNQLARSIALAAKGRSDDADEVADFADDIANRVVGALRGHPIVTSAQIAAETMRYLRMDDPVTYLRYAAAVKGFRTAEDFWWEACALLNTPGLPPPVKADWRGSRT